MKSVTRFAAAAVLAAITSCTWAQAAPDAGAAFAPVDQWKSAVLAGDVAALKALYSTSPAAQTAAGLVL